MQKFDLSNTFVQKINLNNSCVQKFDLNNTFVQKFDLCNTCVQKFDLNNTFVQKFYRDLKIITMTQKERG